MPTTTKRNKTRRLIAAAATGLMLTLSSDLALAQSQAAKTGTGEPLRKLTAGATSGQEAAVAAGGLTAGAVAAAIGVALIIGGIAIASTGGNASASSTQ
jgi:hypothetical protein